ncbi:MAG: hypothetical protein QGF33_12075, partial [Alphaproteobacteria bacterium]|nr:hypothetical protein [Alphaproteobacteria bacterium]
MLQNDFHAANRPIAATCGDNHDFRRVQIGEAGHRHLFRMASGNIAAFNHNGHGVWSISWHDSPPIST